MRIFLFYIGGGLAKAPVGFQPLPRTFVYMLFSRLLPFCLAIMQNKNRSIYENGKKKRAVGAFRQTKEMECEREGQRERDEVATDGN